MPEIASDHPIAAAQASLRVIFAAMKLAAISSVAALAGALPIIIAGVPCLSQTAPQNRLGGRLGSLTDLSLLRLLDARDPSPDSANISNYLRLPMYRRALSSTVRSAIGSARVRLIILLVIIVIISVGGGLFIIARAYSAFANSREEFESEVCHGLDMIFVSAIRAPGWKEKSEERLSKSLKDICRESRKEQSRDIDVVGVFAIP